MDLQALRDRAEARFRDSANDIYSAAEWTSYINDAYADVTAASPWWPFLDAESATITAAALAADVDLGTAINASVFRVHSVYNKTNNYPLSPIFGRGEFRYFYPRPDQDHGSPLNYRLLGQKLQLYPRPSGSIDLLIEYSAPPADLSLDTDVPVFPAQYHRILVEGALARAYEDDGNEQQAERQWGKFNRLLEDMKSDLLSARNETYPQIQDSWDW